MARYIDRYYTAKDLLRAVQHRYDAAGLHGGGIFFNYSVSGGSRVLMTGGWRIGPLEPRISWVGGIYDPTYLVPSTLTSCALLDRFTTAFPQLCAAHSTTALQQLWGHLPASSMRTFTRNRLLLEEIKSLGRRVA